MPEREALEERFKLPAESAKWAGYAVVILLEAAVTLGLSLVQPHLPLGDFPLPYILIVILVAYLYGEGPAALAFLLGFFAYTYFFILPGGPLWPPAANPKGWAGLSVFFIGALIAQIIMLLFRRERRRTLMLANRLAEEKRLAEHRRGQIEAILSSMVNAVIVVDTDRKVSYANQAASRLVSARREIGEPLEDWIRVANIREMDGTPIDVESHPLIRALRGEIVSEELLLIDGESGPNTVVSTSASPIKSPEGEITGAAVIVRNITPQRRLQEETERERALLDTFMRNVPIGLAFLDRQSRITLANSTLAEISGVAPEEMAGKTAVEVLPAGLAAQIERAIREVHATGEPVVWRDFALQPDGRRYFDVAYIPVRTVGRELIGVGMVMVETTEKVRAREQLERIYEREHRIAETLQTALLTAVPERICSFEFETLYRAALEEARVGGDFYDVFPLSEKRIGIAIADVSGKGLTAAQQVAMARSAIRAHFYECEAPSIAMGQVNKTLVRDMDIEGFVTVFAGVLDCDEVTLTYANGGHSPAIRWTASERRAELLCPTGPLLGKIAGATYAERTIHMQLGDELFLGTDGLFEVWCGQRLLEIEGLLTLYTEMKLSGAGSPAVLVERVAELCGGELRDDVAILKIAVMR